MERMERTRIEIKDGEVRGGGSRWQVVVEVEVGFACVGYYGRGTGMYLEPGEGKWLLVLDRYKRRKARIVALVVVVVFAWRGFALLGWAEPGYVLFYGWLMIG